MNIEEIKHARAQAENRIHEELSESQKRVDNELMALSAAIGLQVGPPVVTYVEVVTFGGVRRRLVDQVRIDLTI